jgi:hypothetical protein
MHFLGQVLVQAPQPMQLPAFFTVMKVLHESSPFNSVKDNTSWAQPLIQRPQPMQDSLSMDEMNSGVQDCLSLVKPVMNATFILLLKTQPK